MPNVTHNVNFLLVWTRLNTGDIVEHTLWYECNKIKIQLWYSFNIIHATNYVIKLLLTYKKIISL